MGLERDLERDWGLEVGSCIEPYGLFNYLNPEMEKLLPSQKKKNRRWKIPSHYMPVS